MVTLALDVDRSEVVEGGSLVASVVKESSGKLERPITLSLLTAEGTAQGTNICNCTDIYVPYNFGICAILRLQCAI